MALTVSLSTIPKNLGKAESAGDAKVNLSTVINEHDTALKLYSKALDPLIVAVAGHNGAGAVTLTGAKVGDKVVGVTQLTTTFQDGKANFESTITVADQIQQSSATNFSAVVFQFVIVHLS